MATGFTDTAEQALLDDATSGLGRTLFLALYKWTGTTGAGDGVTVSETNTLPSNLVEVTAGSGYSRLSVASSDWASAVGGAPTVKQFASAVSKTWTATANFGEIVAWALCAASTVNVRDEIVVGPITTSGGTATHVQVNSGDTFGFDTANPIKVQLGDPTDTFS